MENGVELSPEVTVDISNLEMKNHLREKCFGAISIRLEGETTLTADGVRDANVFLNWIFFATNLEMCVYVENADTFREVIIDTETVVGKCEGTFVTNL